MEVFKLNLMYVFITAILSIFCVFDVLAARNTQEIRIAFEYRNNYFYDSIWIYNIGDLDLTDVKINVCIKEGFNGKITEGDERYFKIIEKDSKIIIDDIWYSGIAVKNYILKIDLTCNEGYYQQSFINNIDNWFFDDYNWVPTNWN